MKLLVDMNSEIYKQMQGKDVYKGEHEKICYEAIQNGKPVSNRAIVCNMEQIRADVVQHNRNPRNYPVDMISIETVLQILDKYSMTESVR